MPQDHSDGDTCIMIWTRGSIFSGAIPKAAVLSEITILDLEAGVNRNLTL